MKRKDIKALQYYAVVNAAKSVIKEHGTVTIRQLYYNLAVMGVVEKGDKGSKLVADAVGDARKNEANDLFYIDDASIVDHVRKSSGRDRGYASLDERLDSLVSDYYKRKRWPCMPVAVDVFVEKDALADTLRRVTEEFCVRLHTSRGYFSDGFCSAIAREWEGDERPRRLFYIGDGDPSGFDIERDLCSKLMRWTKRKDIDTARVGATHEDVDAGEFITIPVNEKDVRTPQYCLKHPHRLCLQAEAIPPNTLRERLRTAIQGVIDEHKAAWDANLAKEAEEQEKLTEICDELRDRLEELRPYDDSDEESHD